MAARKNALVTGANRGLGLAIAKGLATQVGLRVLCAARTQIKANAAATEVAHGAVGVVLDLNASPAELAAAAEKMEASYGGVEILVNNAGVLIPGCGRQAEPCDLQATLQVNAIGPYTLIHLFGTSMKRRGWGRIVNVSSGWGAFDEGMGGPIAYAISKATLNAITLSMAGALGSAVKINAMCPGWVRTRMGGQAAARSPEEAAEEVIRLATLPDDGPTGGFFRDKRLIGW